MERRRMERRIRCGYGDMRGIRLWTYDGWMNGWIYGLPYEEPECCGTKDSQRLESRENKRVGRSSQGFDGREKRQLLGRIMGHGKVQGVFVSFVVTSATPKSEYHKFSKRIAFKVVLIRPFRRSQTRSSYHLQVISRHTLSTFFLECNVEFLKSKYHMFPNQFSLSVLSAKPFETHGQGPNHLHIH